MKRVLVVATSRKSTGGISAVIRLYEKSEMWSKFKCRWIETHRDGNVLIKLWYLLRALLIYVFLIPFYDIVHIHFSTTSSARRKYIFFLLAKLSHKKIVIHLHCGTQIEKIWSPIYEHMFIKSDSAIVLSDSLKNTVEKYIGKNEKLHVIYNPCPVINNSLEYEKKNQILFAGHLNIEKGYRDLLVAFSIVLGIHNDWKLVFAGNGEIYEAQSLAKELGISDSVYFVGWVKGNKKHQVFSESRALCLPSYAEGFPMSVLDAWAYGLPVITTPVGGVPDIAVEGENMLLFNPGDTDMLAKKLDIIMSKPFIYNKLVMGSKIMARGQFNLDSVTKKVEDIYYSLS